MGVIARRFAVDLLVPARSPVNAGTRIFSTLIDDVLRRSNTGCRWLQSATNGVPAPPDM